MWKIVFVENDTWPLFTRSEETERARQLSYRKKAPTSSLRVVRPARNVIELCAVRAMHPLITGRHSIHYLPINRRDRCASAHAPPPTEMRTQIRDYSAALNLRVVKRQMQISNHSFGDGPSQKQNFYHNILTNI